MPGFAQVLPALQPHLDEVEHFRQKCIRQRNITMLIGLGLLVAAWLTIGVFNSLTGTGIIAIAGVLALVVAPIRAHGRYRRFFKQRVITAMIKAVNPSLTYNMKGFVPKAVFIQSKIFLQGPDRYKGEDHIKGRVRETDIELSELHCQYRSRDSKGRTQYHTFFKGLFMVADFHKHFHGRTVVLPDTAERLFGGFGKWLQGMSFGRGQVVYMEDPDFEKQFVVYGDDQVEARYILSTSMIRRILDLKQKLDARIYLSFVDSNVHLAVHWRRNLFHPKLRHAAKDTDNLRKHYEELMLCLGIVDDLNLNTRIWSKRVAD